LNLLLDLDFFRMLLKICRGFGDSSIILPIAYKSLCHVDQCARNYLQIVGAYVNAARVCSILPDVILSTIIVLVCIHCPVNGLSQTFQLPEKRRGSGMKAGSRLGGESSEKLR
jgi:hypothetical protein